MIGYLFTARSTNCHFDESIYLALGGENTQSRKEIEWNALLLCYLNHRTNK